MLWLILLGVILAYVFVAILPAILAAKLAKRHGIAGWKFALPVLVAIHLLVLWDWIPMEIMYRHYCNEEAGVTYYKLLDEWKEENPGVAESLQPSTRHRATIENRNYSRYELNQRFVWDHYTTELRFHIRKQEDQLVDTQNNEIIARLVDFDTDIPSLGQSIDREGGYKLWMMKRSCEDIVGTQRTKSEFSKFMHLMKYQKEIKDEHHKQFYSRE